MYSARNLANQYRSTSVSSAVLEANPHQLITLMLSGARERARLAVACIERGDIARKAQAISEASTIVAALDGALNLEAGGEIANGLAALYDYVQRQLFAANAHNDTGILGEVDDLLGDIEAAWRQIAPKDPV